MGDFALVFGEVVFHIFRQDISLSKRGGRRELERSGPTPIFGPKINK